MIYLPSDDYSVGNLQGVDEEFSEELLNVIKVASTQRKKGKGCQMDRMPRQIFCTLSGMMRIELFTFWLLMLQLRSTCLQK